MRLVSTLHADGGDWDALLDNLHAGWEGYLLILRLHLDALRRAPLHDDHGRRPFRR